MKITIENKGNTMIWLLWIELLLGKNLYALNRKEKIVNTNHWKLFLKA